MLATILQIAVVWTLASIALGFLIGAAIPPSEDDDTLYLTTDDLADPDERIVSFFRAQQAAHPWENGVGGNNNMGRFTRSSHGEGV